VAYKTKLFWKEPEFHRAGMKIEEPLSARSHMIKPKQSNKKDYEITEKIHRKQCIIEPAKENGPVDW
jgi:hypothetical protein